MKKQLEHGVHSAVKSALCVTASLAALLFCASCGRISETDAKSVSSDFYTNNGTQAEEVEPEELNAESGEAEIIEEEIDDTGIGVSKVKIDSERHLIMTLSDGSKVDAGYIGGDSSVKGCNVTFVDYNDRLLKFEVVEKGGDATPPADPSREGYSFAGWDVSCENISKDTVITATYTELTDITPEPVYYTVTFADYDGTVIQTQQVEAGHSATPPTDLSREGYSFVGWDASYICIIEDTTFTAQYTEDITALIAAEDVTASAGASGVQVTVELKNNPGIAGMTLKVGYDTTALSLTGVTYGDDFRTGGEKPNYDSAPVTLLWTSLDEVSGDSVYATLSFDVLDAAVSGETYTVSLGYDDGNVFDIDEEGVSFGLKDGAITIE